MVELLAPHLLWRHIGNCAQSCAGAGQDLVLNAFCPFPANLGRTQVWIDLRKSKIQDLGMPSLCNKNIRGLDVAMHDSLAVCRIESLGYFGREREQRLGFQRTARDPMFQCHSVQKFHDEE